MTRMDGPQIVRVKQFVMKPMTPDEAVLEMDMLGHGFFLFENAETGLSSVVYRRSDGGYGLIEPRLARFPGSPRGSKSRRGSV